MPSSSFAPIPRPAWMRREEGEEGWFEGRMGASPLLLL
jgi:hypothetical protein